MPWTRKQIRYLLSKGSPLSEAEKEKIKRELHRDKSLIRSGRKAMKAKHAKKR